ncbi:phage-like protein [Phaeobacter sp. S60]|nr:phage-like protein [Phaeobacter sp. S60]
MNEQVNSLALSLPEPTSLAAILKKQDGLGDMLSKLEAAARKEAEGKDVSTRKGRDALKSIAHKVSQSKVELDKQGLALTEEARKEIEAVNAGRKLAKDRLEALRDEIKKPALDWEAAEAKRVQALTDRLSEIDAGRVDTHSPSEQIASVLAEIEAIEVGEDWQEFKEQASAAKQVAISALQASLAEAQKREADARELEELRALKAAKEEEERKEREARDAEARLQERVDKAKAYIKEVGEGRIGGQPQSFDILIYELDTKLPAIVDELGRYAQDIHDLRNATLSDLKARMEQQRLEDEVRAEQQRKEAAEKAAADAKAKAEREAAEKAEAERHRMEEDKRKADEARAEREADAQHRAKIRTDIIEALASMRGNASPEAIADALMAGQIPHTEVHI